MNRPNQTVITPQGKNLVLKTFLTARERNELRAVYLSGMKLDTGAGAPSIKEVDGLLIDKSEKKLIEIAVISYDGIIENIVSLLLDQRPKEYDFVVAEAGKLNSTLTEAK